MNKNKKIDSLIIEGQDEDTLLLVALSKSKNIQTIMIEHNWLQHHLLGNQIWYYLRKVDKFFSLGWIDKSENKIHPWEVFSRGLDLLNLPWLKILIFFILFFAF